MPRRSYQCRGIILCVGNRISDSFGELDTIQIVIYSFSLLTWIFGFVGNIAMIFMYSNKNMKVRFNVLMITLAIYDLSYLVVHMIIAIAINSETYGVKNVPHMFFGFLGYCTFKGSCYTTIAISLDRFLVLYRNR